jgi:DNA-3-methyladenine glycosylase II
MAFSNPLRFGPDDFDSICRKLGEQDESLGGILSKHGNPPLWSRPQEFSTLIHIILEQQVSLASALAAFEKLKKRLGAITPEALMKLSDEEMRACFFSRQKTVYARELAKVIISGDLRLSELHDKPDEQIRVTLKKIKGIGDWTVDVYLLFAMQRSDLFPTGDLAMMKAFREVKQLPKETTKEEIIAMAEAWRPYRSVATMILWHHYLMR